MKTILTVLLLQAMPQTAQINYDKAYEYLINGKAHTASIYIERSLQRKETLKATLLKARIQYDVFYWDAVRTYNKASRMGDVPTFECLMQGINCKAEHYDWQVLNKKIYKQ